MGNRARVLAAALTALVVGPLAAGPGVAAAERPVVAAEVAATGEQDRVVLNWGSVWRYHSRVEQLPAEPHYSSLWIDEREWSRGVAPFGFGGSEYVTQLISPTRSIFSAFRAEFHLDDLASLDKLVVDAIADDGLVLYVNGTEVGRENLAPGALSPHTYANSSEEETVTFEIPREVLRWGRNVISVGLHANSRDTRALTFDARIRASHTTAEPALRPLNVDATWRYALRDSVPATGWEQSTSVTRQWERGTAPIGWGNRTVATSLRPSATMESLFAQTEFEVADLGSVTSARVTVVADDGVRIVVNGNEVGRANLPGGDLRPGNHANSSYGGTVGFTIPVETLREGTNVIAAQVNKNYRQSPTITFAAQVDLTRVVLATPDPAPGGGDAAPDPDPVPEPGQPGEEPEAAEPIVPPADQDQNPVPPADPEAVVDGWGAPVWQDDFNGDAVDTSLWRVRDGDYLSYDQTVIRSDNVSVRDGNLVIRTEQLNRPVVYRDGRQRWWSTGYVDTIGRSSQKYGRWEIRAQLPIEPGRSRAIWPAIWMRDVNGPGEIDLMEAFGAPHDGMRYLPDGTWSVTVHEASTGADRGERLKYDDKRLGHEHIGLDYHTWVLEWTPEGMTVLLDDELIWSASADDHPWLNDGFSEEGVDLRINTQVGHSWGGYATPNRPDQTRTPAEFKIDYVRVWEYNG